MAKRSIQSYSRTSGSGPGLDNRGKTDLGQPPRRVNCDQNWPSHIHLTRNFSITHSSHAKRLYHTSITRRKTFITHPCDKVSRQKQLLCHWKPYCGGIFMERNSLERATAFALRISRRSFFVSDYAISSFIIIVCNVFVTFLCISNNITCKIRSNCVK